MTGAGYGLANESNPGINASGWASMFSQVPNTEGIFVTLYNTLVQGTPDYRKNNTWEHGIRPNNTLGGGGKTPSAMLVDMFPMRDGKVPGGCNTYTKLDKSESDYNPQFPFIDRDPRFTVHLLFRVSVGHLPVILEMIITIILIMVLTMRTLELRVVYFSRFTR